MRKDLHEQNRRSWNKATVAHNSHKRDQAAFLRGGGSTLFDEELGLLGELGGRRLVHLQCNSGQDTLSLAARGADVTGVDISDEAIAFAQQLATDSGIPGRFERADVLDWLTAAAAAGHTYDVVFSSYGTFVWLSDLQAWARGIAAILAPGGVLANVEFHPMRSLFEERDGAMTWAAAAPNAGGGSHVAWAEGVGDYVADSGDGLVPSGYQTGVEGFTNTESCHEFDWTFADVLDAVAGAGLVLEAVREWPHSNGCKLFPTMIESSPRRFTLPAGAPRIPLMAGFRARKT